MNKIAAAVVGLGAGAAMTVALAVPAQANGRPVYQQVDMPASGLCADVSAPTSLNWSGVASGGWTKQWGAWVNSGRGGFACGRTLVLNNGTGRYQVQ